MISRHGDSDDVAIDSTEQEHNFDTSEATSAMQVPCVVYAAFLNNSHRDLEITPVLDGYVICLQYDLFPHSKESPKSKIGRAHV